MSGNTASDHLPLPHEIAESTFVGLLWVGVVLALLFLAFRIYVRIKSFHRLFWDDYLVLMAWLMLLANAIMWQYAKTGLYLLMNVENNGQSFPPDFGRRLDGYSLKSIAISILFYSSLWCVKFSFLIFFRRLGQKVPRQKIIWWSVLVLVVAPLFVLLGVIRWHCYITREGKMTEDCETPKSVASQRAMFQACCAVDIITDAMIIFVPLNVLWRVQINFWRKLVLAGIFSLTAIIMVIAIVRVTLAYRHGAQPDLTWMWMWAAIEQTVAIIVACLASFRTLFTQQDRSQRRLDLRDISSSRTPSQGNKTKSPVKYKNKSSWDVDGNLAPPSKGIHVQRDFDVIYNVERPHEVV